MMAEQVTEKEVSTVKVVAAAEKRRDQAGGTQELEKEITPTRRRLETQPMGQLGMDETENYRARWNTIQTGFVDEPRGAVEQADALVAELLKRLSDTFSRERAQLEGQWDRNDNASTEDLRVALQGYRSFFGRLLAIYWPDK